MQITFMHIADLHLGNRQYQLDERFNDFYLAFDRIADEAIHRHVEFVLIAGDIFHKRAIDAITLYQATHVFERLREAGISVLAIEGNHDKAYYSDGSTSWLSFLAWRSGIHLLSPAYADGRLHFQPQEAYDSRGSFDLPGTGIRVYGIPWAGAQTARIIQWAADALTATRAEEEMQGIRYRILMLHTGIEGIVPNLHGLPTAEQFEPLRGLIDYIALGHVHKPYTIDEWLYNPGSLETVSAEEITWPERGYYFATIDLDTAPKPQHHAELIATKRRPFLRKTFLVDGITDPASFEARYTEFVDRLQRDIDKLTTPPIVDIALRGTLSFDQGSLDRRKLETLVATRTHPLHVIVRNQMRTLDAILPEGDLDALDRASWQALEQQIFQAHFLRDERYAPRAEEWAHVLATLKEHALQSDDPASLSAWLAEERARLSKPE
jgi:DNA repair protein SbcD/Mre11